MRKSADYSGPPQLRVHLLAAENLLARNNVTGTSNPVAIVYCGTESHMSSEKQSTCNPHWGERIAFTSSASNDVTKVENLHIQIKDKSSKSSTSVNLGAAVIPLKPLIDSKGFRIRPQWYTLQMTEGMARVSGRVRVGLRVLGVKRNDPKLKKVLPPRVNAPKKYSSPQNYETLEPVVLPPIAPSAAQPKATVQKIVEKKSVKVKNTEDRATRANIQRGAQDNRFEKVSQTDDSLAHRVARAISRLRERSTRSSARDELRQMSHSFDERGISIALRCLRTLEGVDDVAFQCECAAVFGVLASTCPRACVPYIDSFVSSICRRITSCVSTAQHDTALALSIALVVRHVVPIALSGRSKPSIEKIVSPIYDVLETHIHADRGAAAAKCLEAIFRPLPRSATENVSRITIVGLTAQDSETKDICRRKFFAAVKNLPSKPLRVGVDKEERRLWIEVPSNEASNIYKVVVSSRNLLPVGWTVAAQNYDVEVAAECSDRENYNDTADDPEFLKMIGSCSRSIIMPDNSFLRILHRTRGAARAACFDVVSSFLVAARRGEKHGEVRMTSMVSKYSSVIVQQILSSLQAQKKSWNWKTRKSALHTVTEAARLDITTLPRLPPSERKINETKTLIFGPEIDMVVLVDEIKKCLLDKVNVVRVAASEALQVLNRSGSYDSKNRQSQDCAKIEPESVGAKSVEPSLEPEVIHRKDKRVEGKKIRKTKLRLREVTAASGPDLEKAKVNKIPSKPAQPKKVTHFEDTEKVSQNCPEAPGSDLHGDPRPKVMPDSVLAELSEDQRTKLSDDVDKCLLQPQVMIFDCIVKALEENEKEKETRDGDSNQYAYAENLMANIRDDGLTLGEVYASMSNSQAVQVLAIAASAMQRIAAMCRSLDFSIRVDEFQMTPDEALTAFLRWILAALNSSRWGMVEMIHSGGIWGQVRSACNSLASRSSKFSKKAHAAKIYALLSSPVLLESHLQIFGQNTPVDTSGWENEPQHIGNNLKTNPVNN